MPSSPLDPTKVEEANDRESAFRRGLQEIDDLLDRGVGLSGHEPNCFFLNLGHDAGSSRFATAGAAFGLDHTDDSRAVAITDWDGDGDLDLWISNRTAPMLRFLRNDASPPNDRWIAVRLEGRTVNRDAIGARLELSLDDGRTLHRTLRAGEGYLAQSSKWIHFGLGIGEGTRIAGLRIRWPGGETEPIDGLQAGRRHHIVEGSGRAVPLEAVDAPDPDSIARGSPPGGDPPVPDHASGVSRALVASRWPMPRLPWRDWADAPQSAGGVTGRPLLVQLWATWCAPCLGEMKALTASREQLDGAGIEVLLLSVDGLGEDSGVASGDDPQAFLRNHDIPFPAGRATDELIRRLEVASARLFGIRWPLPVPTSVLLDGDGRIAALYRGPVAVDQILSDAASLDLNSGAFHDAALPFPGQWLHRPQPLDPLFLAIDLMNHEQIDDARELAYRGASDFRDRPEYAQLLTWLGDRLVAGGQDRDALTAYRTAVAVDHSNVVVLNNLAWQLAAHPDDHLRDGREALELALRAAALTDHQDPAVLDTLAAAYAETGRFNEARATARRALDLARDRNENALAEGIAAGLRFYDADKRHGR